MFFKLLFLILQKFHKIKINRHKTTQSIANHQIQFLCVKNISILKKKKHCENNTYMIDEIREVGNFISKVLNVQNRRFKTVTCNKCGYTEYYERSQSILANVLDLVIR
jgi:uncharacterized protein